MARMGYRDDQDALMGRLAALERQVQRTEQLEQRVRELEQENRRLRGAAEHKAVPPPAAARSTAEIYVDAKIHDYIADILAATRGSLPELADQVLSGARPDDAELVLEAASARAVEAGRPYVVPTDIVAVAPGILAGRVILSGRAEQDGLTVDALINRVLELVEVP